jgi:hypothetical protein
MERGKSLTPLACSLSTVMSRAGIHGRMASLMSTTKIATWSARFRAKASLLRK